MLIKGQGRADTSLARCDYKATLLLPLPIYERMSWSSCAFKVNLNNLTIDGRKLTSESLNKGGG